MTPEERTVLRHLFPIAPASYAIKPDGNVGLVIVDPVCGFTRDGNLADPERMVPMVRKIVDEYRRLHEMLGDRLRVLVFMDSHEADIPEPPYPPHCIRETPEELLDPELAFLAEDPNVGFIQKGCINGFVGSQFRGRSWGFLVNPWTNEFVDWVVEQELQTLVFVGDCTDICVADLVLTTLSARNHGMFTTIDPDDDREAYVKAITQMDIVVLETACETFEAPSHDREAWHHVGLAMMASRGAKIADQLEIL